MPAPQKRPTEAWVDQRLLDGKYGQIIIARFKLTGEAEIGAFLVDPLCLGVKQAYYMRASGEEYERRLHRSFGDPGSRAVAITPACARKRVEAAVAYARKAGLEPHPDYRQAQRVFGGINPDECTEEFTFGNQGKPFYIQSPNDSPAFTQHVLQQLQRHYGEGGFDYLIELGDEPAD